MIAAIHQPQYLPWIGYFDKMLKADVFCYLDNVQFKKNEWQNRNRIKTAQGRQWLTVPVTYRFPQRIHEVSINHAVDWRKKHFQSLISNYNKAPFFKEHLLFFEQVYARNWDYISELNIYFIEYIRAKLGLGEKPTALASRLKLAEDPTGRLIDICRAVGADTYLAGPGGAGYMDLEKFKTAGIRVITQDFQHPTYPQRFGAFVSHLSIVDLLFNCGPHSLEKILEINPLSTVQTERRQYAKDEYSGNRGSSG